MNHVYQVNPHAQITCPYCTVTTAVTRSTGTARGYTEMVIIYHQPYCATTLGVEPVRGEDDAA